MENYIVDTSRPLGEGSFGRVYRAKERRTGEIFAVKQIKFDLYAQGIPGALMREISIMEELEHKRIAQIHQVAYLDAGSMCIVMEYADMDLRKYLNLVRRNNAGAPLPAPLVQRFSRHLMKGLQYCHAHRVIHRDLKPSNLLIDAKQCLKIADFGLSVVHSLPVQTFTPEVSTLRYRPPEILLGDLDYTTSFDIWSAGCIIAEMARGGETLFKGNNETEQLNRIFELLGTPDEELWPGVTKLQGWSDELPKHETKNMVEHIPTIPEEGVDLVMQCLFYPPRYRISAVRALLHPWLNKRIPPSFPEGLMSFYLDCL